MDGLFVLHNLLAVLWILLFVKTKREHRLQITHVLFLAIAVGILVHSCWTVFYSTGIRDF